MSASLSLTLSLFDGLTQTAPRPETAPVAAWASFLRSHYERGYPSKDACPGFAPARWAPGHGRGLAGLEAVHAVVLDLDDVSDLDLARLVASQIRGRQFILYSTWSHPTARAANPPRSKLRLVLPLSRAVTSDEWPAVWRRVAYHLGGGVAQKVAGVRVEGSGLSDGACKDASHFYYVPAQPPGSPAPSWFCDLDAPPFAPEEILSWPDAPEDAPTPTIDRLLMDAVELSSRGRKLAALGVSFTALARGEAFAVEGGRDDTTFRLLCEIVRRYPHVRDELLEAVIEPSRLAMAAANPTDHLSAEQIRGKIARARAAVNAERLEREAETAEILGSFQRVQGWQRNEQIPGPAGLLETVLSDGARVPIGCPEIRGGDDTSIAYHVIARLGAPCVTAGGATYLYRPELGVWRPLTAPEIKRRVRAVQGRQYTSATRPGVVALSDRQVEAVVRTLREVTAEREGWFLDGEPGVAFSDGFVGADLRARPHDPCNRAVHRVDGPFDPAASAPAWSRTVREVLAVVDEPDFLEDDGRTADQETEDKVRALEEWVGAALLGQATRLHRALVLVGNPGTGKSTLGSAVARLWAPETTSGVQPTRFSDPVWAAELAGMTLNYLGEADAGVVRDPSHIKAAITGDEIMGAPKYERPFKFRPRAAQLWCYNVLPIYLDDSSAIAVRMLVLRCEQVFRDTERDDPGRGERLAAETAQIASRCLVAGARALARGRHELPASARAEIAAWSASSNPVREWLSAHAETCPPGEGSTLDEIHHAYRTWVESMGRDRSVPTPQGLAQRLRSMGYRQTRRREGSGQRVWRWSLRVRTSSAAAAIAATVQSINAATSRRPS